MAEGPLRVAGAMMEGVGDIYAGASQAVQFGEQTDVARFNKWKRAEEQNAFYAAKKKALKSEEFRKGLYHGILSDPQLSKYSHLVPDPAATDAETFMVGVTNAYEKMQEDDRRRKEREATKQQISRIPPDVKSQEQAFRTVGPDATERTATHVERAYPREKDIALAEQRRAPDVGDQLSAARLNLAQEKFGYEKEQDKLRSLYERREELEDKAGDQTLSFSDEGKQQLKKYKDDLRAVNDQIKILEGRKEREKVESIETIDDAQKRVQEIMAQGNAGPLDAWRGVFHEMVTSIPGAEEEQAEVIQLIGQYLDQGISPRVIFERIKQIEGTNAQ